MNSLRLKTIASFIEKNDRVADIGCDHAYLAIYLVKEHLCESVLASDIHVNALNNAKKNIQKEHLDKEISTVLSDGLENVNQKGLNTLVLSGMGTTTILHVVEKVEKDYIKKIIIQSNHDLYTLRKILPKFGYYLKEEKIIYEKKHYYTIGVYMQERRKLTKRELLFGLYNEQNKAYYSYLYKELIKINNRLSIKYLKEKIVLVSKIHLLKRYL